MSNHSRNRDIDMPANQDEAKVAIKEPSLATHITGYLMMLVGFPMYSWGCTETFTNEDDLGFWALLLGGILLIGGGFVLQPPDIKLNKPTERDEENWRTVRHKTFTKIAEAVDTSIKQTYSSLNLGCGSGCVVYGILCTVFIAIFTNTAENYSFDSFIGPATGLAMLLLPFCSGNKLRTFVPPLLEKKMHHFVNYRKIIDECQCPDVNINEQIRFDRDLAGKEIPEDVKYIFSLKKPPKCFVTSQLVLTFTNVQSTEYEFLYSVFVFDKKMRSASEKAINIIREHLDDNDIGMGVEVNTDHNYYVAVFKLVSGYHTNKRKAETVVRLTLEALQVLANEYKGE